MYIFNYRKLNAYQHAKSLTCFVYTLIKEFPIEERYALSEQIRRAAVSIPSNLAEGASRSSLKEQIHFIEIAFGSLNELMCQLEISYSLNYITSEQLERVETQVKIVAQLMSGLKKSKEQELAK
jgi:four helix bundle protein